MYELVELAAHVAERIEVEVAVEVERDRDRRVPLCACKSFGCATAAIISAA
jgi:hypothetical protein